MPIRLPLTGLLFCVALSITVPSQAAEPVILPPGGSQGALALGFDQTGNLWANVCPTARCAPTDGQRLELPKEALAHHAQASVEKYSIGYQHSAAIVRIPGAQEGTSYDLIVAASVNEARPHVVFQGWTGLVQGQDGERGGAMIHFGEPSTKGVVRIVVGQQREDVTICGRPSVLGPQVLHPKDLKLYSALVQRLDPAERQAAPRLDAVRDEAQVSAAVLHAVGASSATGAPQALTDGDPETYWAENRGGAGKGEFVTLNAPGNLPISGFQITVRPPTTEVPNGVSPRELWIATTRELYLVTLPEDAWQHPGARYRATLPKPITTDCVALVTESAFSEAKGVQLTVAELGAVPAVESTKISDLVAQLAGGGDEAEAAKWLLMAGGGEAFAAVAEAFKGLDEGGRRVALQVIDQAPCVDATPTYVRALLGRYEAHRLHARERLRRCGDEGAPYLAKTLARATTQAKRLLADELALISPESALKAIPPLLAVESANQRRELRAALALAARQPTAENAVEGLLSDSSLTPPVRLELLRALGASVAEYPAAQETFDALRGTTDFRTRYLLLGPAAELAARHEPARTFLVQALSTDKNHHLRAAAARLAAPALRYRTELLNAARDPAVRVREAAVTSLSGAPFAIPTLLTALKDDRWPLVRGAAASSLAGAAPDPRVDHALGEALDDASPIVRAPSISAAAARRQTSLLPRFRDLASDRDEHTQVRRAAVDALGALCDRKALDLLTELAQRRADPLLEPPDQALADHALQALSRLAPPDMKQRLAPLFQKGAAPGSGAAATRAMAHGGACNAR